MTARQAAARAAVARALEQAIKQTRTAANAGVLDELAAGDRVGARLDNGASIGTVSVSSRTSARVVDEYAFTDWVRTAAPSELVESVRKSYRDKLLKQLEDLDGQAVDPATGELVPGVEFSTGDPYVSVRQSEDQVAAVGAAWLSGQLSELLTETLGQLGPGDE